MKSSFLKRTVCGILSFVFVFCTLVSCGDNGANNNVMPYEEKIAKSYGFEGEIDGVSFSLIDLGKEVGFKSSTQRVFLNQLKSNLASIENDTSFNEENITTYYDIIHRYAKGLSELSRPDAITLKWSVSSEKTIDSYEVAIFEEDCLSGFDDVSDPYFLVTEETEISVYNLKTATVYYWTVSAITDNGKIKSGEACFTTSDDLPRNIYCDGVTNFRDIGGYKTKHGKRVEQGLIYRCAALNYKSNIGITESGLETLDRLGIKTEIDLRGNEESGYISQGYLGNDMGYFRVPMVYEGNALTANFEQIKEVFDILAQEDNYPLIFHCAIGTDRTGLIAFLINGLLGVDVRDLYLDYVWSNFGNIGSSRSAELIKNNYVWLIEPYDGAELKDKVYNYLNKEVGIDKAVLNKIMYILLER